MEEEKIIVKKDEEYVNPFLAPGSDYRKKILEQSVKPYVAKKKGLVFKEWDAVRDENFKPRVEELREEIETESIPEKIELLEETVEEIDVPEIEEIDIPEEINIPEIEEAVILENSWEELEAESISEEIETEDVPEEVKLPEEINVLEVESEDNLEQILDQSLENALKILDEENVTEIVQTEVKDFIKTDSAEVAEPNRIITAPMGGGFKRKEIVPKKEKTTHNIFNKRRK